MLASWQAAELMAAQPEGGVIINMSWDHVLDRHARARIRSCSPPSRAA